MKNYELDLFDPFMGFDSFFKPSTLERKDNRLMRADVRELENSYAIDLEVPGVDKKNVSIDLTDGYLNITAKNEKCENEESKKYIRQERHFGQITRSFYVGDVSEKDIQAKMENGILTVSVPKETKHEEKKFIEIK